jgi:hypothetical protein
MSAPLDSLVPDSLVLDIGADVGALVLYTPASMDGQEIEIASAAHRTHSVVRRRQTPARTVYAAVYPGLPAGEYAVGGSTATITGGSVTSCGWLD